MPLWIDKKMDWLAPCSCKRGRAEKFSHAAIQFCLMVKNLFGLGTKTGYRHSSQFVESVWPILADA